MESTQNIDRNALLTAVAQRKLKLVRLLTEGGAEVDYKGYDGKTALSIACSFLIESGENSNVLGIVRLLLKHGANPNSQDMKGRTPLMYALRHRLEENVIAMLLENGADPNILDKNGKDATGFIHLNSIYKYYIVLKKYLKPEIRQRLRKIMLSSKLTHIVDLDNEMVHHSYDGILNSQVDKTTRCYSDQSVNETNQYLRQSPRRHSVEIDGNLHPLLRRKSYETLRVFTDYKTRSPSRRHSDIYGPQNTEQTISSPLQHSTIMTNDAVKCINNEIKSPRKRRPLQREQCISHFPTTLNVLQTIESVDEPDNEADPKLEGQDASYSTIKADEKQGSKRQIQSNILDQSMVTINMVTGYKDDSLNYLNENLQKDKVKHANCTSRCDGIKQLGVESLRFDRDIVQKGIFGGRTKLPPITQIRQC